MFGGTVENEGWGTGTGSIDRLVEGVAESNILFTDLVSLQPFARFALGPGLMGEAKRLPRDVERQRNIINWTLLKLTNS